MPQPINFENMLLKPLLKYQDHAYSADVLLHTNVVDRINNPRGKEVNVELPGPDAWGVPALPLFRRGPG